jgi:hypothetical protein
MILLKVRISKWFVWSGSMAEPENIIAFLEADLESKLPLKGKQFNYRRSHL